MTRPATYIFRYEDIPPEMERRKAGRRVRDSQEEVGRAFNKYRWDQENARIAQRLAGRGARPKFPKGAP